jgi:hypothetical protein
MDSSVGDETSRSTWLFLEMRIDLGYVRRSREHTRDQTLQKAFARTSVALSNRPSFWQTKRIASHCMHMSKLGCIPRSAQKGGCMHIRVETHGLQHVELENTQIQHPASPLAHSDVNVTPYYCSLHANPAPQLPQHATRPGMRAANPRSSPARSRWVARITIAPRSSS